MLESCPPVHETIAVSDYENIQHQRNRMTEKKQSHKNNHTLDPKLKGIDIAKSWLGPGQKYYLLYLAASTHPVSLCS